MTAYEEGQLVRLAWDVEKRRDSGLIPDMNEYEKIPYIDQAKERLSCGCNYLKTLVKNMGYYS